MKNKSASLVLSLFLVSSLLWKIDFAKGADDFAGCVDGASVLTVNADDSGDCETIQDAIDNIVDGGLISVGEGTYQENLVLEGKSLDLRGVVEDPSLVIIDANYSGSAIYIQNYSGDGDIVIEGFTIINGYATDGGGVYVYNSSVSISSCVFYNDISSGAGGAFSVYSPTGNIVIEKSEFHDNTASSGGAINASYIENGNTITIKNSLFYDNEATNRGGAMYFGVYAYPSVFNNTFSENLAKNDGGAIYIYGDSSDLNVKNNIFYRNVAGYENSNIVNGGGIYLGSYLLSGVIDYNDFYYNDDNALYVYNGSKTPVTVGAGNTTSDPVFSDATNHDFTLFESSSLIDIGTDSVTEDFDGKSRPIGEGYDIGAYEYGTAETIAESEPEEDSATEIALEETYCIDNGGTIEDRTYEGGDTYSVCMFIDGSECETDLYYVGFCNIGDSLDVSTEPVDETTCGDFPDVDSADFSTDECVAIAWVQGEGIFTGNDETGELKPKEEINRAETTKVLIEAFGFDPVAYDSTYSDVVNDAWYTPYIMAATEHSIVEGYEDGTFKPESTVNKVEMLKIILETAGVDLSSVDTSEELFSDVAVDESTEWYRKYAYYAYLNGLIDVDGDEFKPAEGMLREDVIIVLYRLGIED